MAVVLITGASGLLGGNLARDLAGEHQVSGVFWRHRLVVPAVKMIGADLTQPELTRRVVGKVQPELVIHCAAATDVDRCEREEGWAFRLNEQMADNVALAAAAEGAALIHVSTDAVFDGRQGGYAEDSQPDPINVYGRSKLAGEQAVRAAHPGPIIVRTNLFGRTLRPDKRSLAEWFLAGLAKGRSVPGFDDVFFSPILVNDLGELLLALWAQKAKGLFHVGGADCLTKFQFGRRVAARFGFDPNLIERSSVDQVGLAAPRPKKLCLNSGKVEATLGRPVPDVEGGLDRLFASAGSWAPAPGNERPEAAGRPRRSGAIWR